MFSAHNKKSSISRAKYLFIIQPTFRIHRKKSPINNTRRVAPLCIVSSTSVLPKVNITTDVTAVYDYPNLVNSTDYLQIMAYDQHWATPRRVLLRRSAGEIKLRMIQNHK
jgi:spore germination protein YaaH